MSKGLTAHRRILNDVLLERLAERAKRLTRGMIDRTGRQPDTADFLAAFKAEIRGEPDEQEKSS